MTREALLIEIIGLLGFATNVWANILLARKTESGWVIRLGANALWLAYGFSAMSLANILSSGVFSVINVYGWRRWRRERLAGPPVCIVCADRTKTDRNNRAIVPKITTFEITDEMINEAVKQAFPSPSKRPEAFSIVGEIDDTIRKENPRD